MKYGTKYIRQGYSTRRGPLPPMEPGRNSVYGWEIGAGFGVPTISRADPPFPSDFLDQCARSLALFSRDTYC
ncbi:hypothetical protein LZ31DRAFT_379350 [Colletotrichum somersetense]|nr:hypothetical protein LZ31DRAFT_379350 [Colletotrichum somersetense]